MKENILMEDMILTDLTNFEIQLIKVLFVFHFISHLPQGEHFFFQK